MPEVTYKCSSCGGFLNFDPDTQKWKCPYCGSLVSEKDVSSSFSEDSAKKQNSNEKTEDGIGTQVIYRCNSCGSEIITDETTVATHCYYCHNPVVLEGKLDADKRPDRVLPFTISKNKAVQSFLEWAKNKKFVPKDFFNEQEIQTMSGVYYPHFVTDMSVLGKLQGEARKVHVTETFNTITTKTEYYHIQRECTLQVQNIMRPALKAANRKLSDAIHPFPLENAKPFSGAYLSGFLAERKDMDLSDAQQDVFNEVQSYVKPLMQTSVSGYDAYSLEATSRQKAVRSQYVLLPTWVLTYPNRKEPDQPYYYAMNGCTGETCGKLPIDRKKLWLTALGIGTIVFALCCVCSYYLF